MSHFGGESSGTWNTQTPADELTKAEARGLAASAGLSGPVADAIYLMAQGWKQYFLLCVQEAIASDIAEPTEVVGRLRTGPHLQPLIDECVERCSEADLAIAKMIAMLGCVPRQFIKRLGGDDALERLQAGGLPLVECERGIALAAPLDFHLMPRQRLDDDAAAEIAAELKASCGSQRAAGLLVKAGYTGAAASLLSKVDPSDIDESNHAVLGATLTTILDVEKDDGSLGLLLARVHHNAGELDLQRSALENASQAAREQLRLDLAVEADAELLMVSLPTLDTDDAEQRLVEIQREASEHSTSHAVVRLREISEALLLHTCELGAIYRSVSRLQSVAKQWEAIGEPERAASTLRMLVSTSLMHLGQYPVGAQLMRDARELVRTSPQALLRVLSLQCRMGALAGDIDDYDRAALEITELSKSVGNSWIDAYLAWSAMIAAGHTRDESQVSLHLGRARQLLQKTGLMDHPTGVVFWADAARSLVNCGKLLQAREVLDAVADRRSQEALEYELANFSVLCRSDPDRREQWSNDLAQSCSLPVARQWAVDLELAFAATRDATSTEVVEIRRVAIEHGLVKLFDSMHKALADIDTSTSVLIRVFGSFAVEIDGVAVSIKSKRAVELLALLAVRGRPLHVEVIVDRLWPEATLDVGITRLRNVVKRAREAVGADGVVRDGDMICLSSTVRVDLHEAEARLREFEVAPNLNVDSLFETLGMYRGALLEEFLYSDWVSARRFEVSERIARAAEIAIRDGLATPAVLTGRTASRPSVGSPLEQVLANAIGNQGHAPAQY